MELVAALIWQIIGQTCTAIEIDIVNSLIPRLTICTNMPLSKWRLLKMFSKQLSEKCTGNLIHPLLCFRVIFAYNFCTNWWFDIIVPTDSDQLTTFLHWLNISWPIYFHHSPLWLANDDIISDILQNVKLKVTKQLLWKEYIEVKDNIRSWC